MEDAKKARRSAISAVVFLAAGFVLVSEFNVGRSYGWDEGVYLASARLVNHGHRLFQEVFSSQPPVFVETIALAFRLFGDKAEVGTRAVVACGLVVLLSGAWAASRLLGPWAASVSMLALLSKAFFDQAITVEAEIPALALALLSVALLVPPRSDGRTRAALAGGCFALALLSKLWVAPYAVPCVLLLFVDGEGNGSLAWQPRRAGLTTSLDRVLVFGLTATLVGALVLSRYDLKSLYAQAVGFHLAAAERGRGLFARSGQDVLLRFAAHNASIGLLALLGCFALFRRNRLACLFVVCWTLVSAALVLWNTPSFDRHALLVAPPTAILAAAGALPLVRGGRGRKAAAIVGLLVLLVLRPSFAEGGFSWTMPLATQLPAVSNPDPQQDEAVRLIQDLTKPGDIVAADAPLLAFLAGRDVPPRLVDVSGTRIISGAITTEMAIAESMDARLVVFWGDRFDRLPGYRSWVQTRYRRTANWRTAVGRRELYARD